MGTTIVVLSFLVSSAASAQSSDAPTLYDPRILAPLVIIAALILVGVVFLRVTAAGRTATTDDSLGQVLGSVSLSSEAALHYVATGGRVLVVGVSPGSVALVAEFDEDEFDGIDEPSGGSMTPAQLLESLQSATAAPMKDAAEVGDEDGAEMASLRSDIERLQSFLREESTDRHDT